MTRPKHLKLQAVESTVEPMEQEKPSHRLQQISVLYHQSIRHQDNEETAEETGISLKIWKSPEPRLLGSLRGSRPGFHHDDQKKRKAFSTYLLKHREPTLLDLSQESDRSSAKKSMTEACSIDCRISREAIGEHIDPPTSITDRLLLAQTQSTILPQQVESSITVNHTDSERHQNVLSTSRLSQNKTKLELGVKSSQLSHKVHIRHSPVASLTSDRSGKNGEEFTKQPNSILTPRERRKTQTRINCSKLGSQNSTRICLSKKSVRFSDQNHVIIFSDA